MLYTLDVRRTQVLLKEEQHRALAAMSRRTGRGISALIREAVDKLLGGKKTAKELRLSDICAIGRGGPPLSNADIDRIIYEEDA